jgi:aminoglycoside phosphotransferase (APT) family kinase protein
MTTALASQLVAGQFPQWAALPVTPIDSDGNDNTTFRLGDKMLVRLPTADQYTLQVEKEQRWLPVLAAQLPFPIPEPLAKG